MAVSLSAIYKLLLGHFGPQHWWPGDSPFEVVVGALLTQNTAWKNVERALTNLRQAGVLEASKLYEMPLEELAELIRPAGYYRVKAKRLRNFLEFLFSRYEGSLERMFATNVATLREELLEVSGIGPETADSILLYAGNLPSFVIDSYTARVFKRHGWVEPEADYHTLKEFFESRLPEDDRLFNEYHALLVRLAKDYCKKAPACDECPLHDFLPENGSLLELA